MIVQVLPTISYGDAIGNHAIALKKCIKDLGYKTEIYANHVDARLPKGTAKSVKNIPKFKKDDVVIYHMSTGSHFNIQFGKLNCKKVMIYHNITPPEFLEEYNYEAAENCRRGLAELSFLSDKVDYCIAVSEFNKRDLLAAGFKCKIDVLPILIAYGDYDKKPNEYLLENLKDGVTNILFTGRIAANKKQEDVIAAFAEYQKHFNPKSRLILIGNDGGYEKYRRRLQRFAKQLGVHDVKFTGHIKFNAILSYYRAADLFLCMSEHEGFCVPLVEAMYFRKPIVAFESTAIPETLGGGGIVLHEKNPLETAAVMDKVIRDENLRNTIIENQNKRLEDFSNEVIIERFKEILKENIL